MKLQTQIPLQSQPLNPIDYHSKLLLLGSCFVENIGKKLEYFKFQNSVNPFGIMFHPFAIETIIAKAINEKRFTEEDVFYHNEQWHCFEAHSQLSNPSKEALLQKLNKQITSTNQSLKQATHLVMTLGTAWAYRYIETDLFVANCHKVPQKKFLKEIVSIDAITESLESITALVKSINPKVSILFTVSPVRHLKDGFIENTQSKSHLLSAIHQVVDPRKKLYYFPSYEIMMDELRDYRFYNEDMIHPNKTAIQYMWGKFQKIWITESAYETMHQVESIQKGLDHRPSNPNTEAHLQFLEQLKQNQTLVKQQFPHINF